MRSIFPERVAEGFYINIDVNRAEAARYGLTVGDVQRVITSGIGGDNIAENVEGRERYSISVRYVPPTSGTMSMKLRQILVATPSNGQVPLGDLAKISFSRGPSMIRDEDAALTGYVYIDLNTKDYGGFVDRADKLLHDNLALPAGYSFKWSGEYEFELRAKQRLKLILPVVFFMIFLLALPGLPFGGGSDCIDFSHHLRYVRRTAVAVVAGIQLQRRRLGRLHCVVRNRGADGRRDGRVSARGCSIVSASRDRRSPTRIFTTPRSKALSTGCAQN